MSGTVLDNKTVFQFTNGIWKSKHGPYIKASILRSTNFVGDTSLSYDNFAEVDIEDRIAEKNALQYGDIIIERSGGGPKQPVGRVAFFEKRKDELFFAGNFTSVLRIIDQSAFHPRYVSYYLHFLYAAGATNTLQRATTGIRNLDWSAYKKFEIPELPLKEQKAVASVLLMIQRSYRHERLGEQNAVELKKAAMHNLFTRGLRGESQKETEIGPVPESWNIQPLGSIASLERGRFMHRPRNEPRFYGGHMPFIQTGDVVRSRGRIREYTQTLNDQGIRISRVFPKGTILMTIAANIGYTGILCMDAACPDSLVAISPDDSAVVQYLHYYLQTQQPKMDQAAPKGTQKNINIQFLSPWPVPLPPTEDEQREIVGILEAVDQKIDLHRRKKAVLEELFKSLLHKLMTGEVRVGDLDLSALESLPPETQGGAA